MVSLPPDRRLFAAGAATGELVPVVNVKSPGVLPGRGFAVLIRCLLKEKHRMWKICFSRTLAGRGTVLRRVAGANIPISFQLEEGDKK